MTKIKRLATTTDPVCLIDPNITSTEMKQREVDYDTLSDKKMKTTYINSAFRPVYLHWKGKAYDIQLNFCSNPFCKNFSQSQISYGVGKIKRYKMTGKEEERTINCVPDLTNVRKKGHPRTKGTVSEKQLPTQIVVSTDSQSRYVFRTDVAYDWEIDFKHLEQDTETYKDDHLPVELRKNAKYTKYSYYPMEPTPNDTQSQSEYYLEMKELQLRGKYVDGLHVNHTYYNFYQPFKAYGDELTPAQRIGIANRVYSWRDIIYKR